LPEPSSRLGLALLLVGVAVRSAPSSASAAPFSLIIQPAFHGSAERLSTFSASAVLTAATSPPTGVKSSETAFTDSISPKRSPFFSFAPTAGSERKVRSERCSTANAVMPTRTKAPSFFAHSCDAR
jgi:hypothetical protein